MTFEGNVLHPKMLLWRSTQTPVSYCDNAQIGLIRAELCIDDINKNAEGWETGLPLPFGRKLCLHKCDVAFVRDCAEFHFIFHTGHQNIIGHGEECRRPGQMRLDTHVQFILLDFDDIGHHTLVSTPGYLEILYRNILCLRERRDKCAGGWQ